MPGVSLLGLKSAFVFPILLPSSTSPSTSEVAVIRNYGEYLLTVPFNRGTKEFENKLIMVKMSDSKTPISLALENIGPLRALLYRTLLPSPFWNK
jgi:hypothetical protein